MSNNIKFFFKATIFRKDRQVVREGTVMAQFPLGALDQITEKAVNEWKRPLIRVELYELHEDGVLVATSTVHQRVEAVLKSNEKLRPSKYKAIREAREQRRQELEDESAAEAETNSGWNEQGVWVGSTPYVPSMKPSERKPFKPPHPETHTWMAKAGTLFQKESFAVLKLNDGKVQHLKGA